MESYLKEALQTMFETGLPAIVYEELTGEDYHPVDGARHVRWWRPDLNRDVKPCERIRRTANKES